MKNNPASDKGIWDKRGLTLRKVSDIIMQSQVTCSLMNRPLARKEKGGSGHRTVSFRY